MSKSIVVEESDSARRLESEDDFHEARVAATGYVFHGVVEDPSSKASKGSKVGTNMLHMARCGKLSKTSAREAKIWFSTIKVAKRLPGRTRRPELDLVQALPARNHPEALG